MLAEKAGTRLPNITIKIEENNASTMMPMVGGHFIQRSFT
jgi:hypothetical protein